jgi:GntR family transcriptional regulator
MGLPAMYLLVRCRVGSARVGIDPEGDVPRYAQLAAILRARIEAGDLAPGRRIPSMTTLQQEYGVSRITIRHAVDLLVEEGLVRTVRGLGTFVSRPG